MGTSGGGGGPTTRGTGTPCRAWRWVVRGVGAAATMGAKRVLGRRVSGRCTDRCSRRRARGRGDGGNRLTNRCGDSGATVGPMASSGARTRSRHRCRSVDTPAAATRRRCSARRTFLYPEGCTGSIPYCVLTILRATLHPPVSNRYRYTPEDTACPASSSPSHGTAWYPGVNRPLTSVRMG